MVCAKLLARDGFLVDRACRPTMLHYRSTLLHSLTTFTFSPMLIFGSREEKQNIVLELFGNFEEDQVGDVPNFCYSCRKNNELIGFLCLLLCVLEPSCDCCIRSNSITSYWILFGRHWHSCPFIGFTLLDVSLAHSVRHCRHQYKFILHSTRVYTILFTFRLRRRLAKRTIRIRERRNRRNSPEK